MEYLQTTFSHDELSKLTLARDVRPEEMDFEMLMQRDINEERAKTALKSYLNPRGSDPATVERTTVFFPPLLIACVPSESNRLLSHYPDETWDDGEPGRLVRRWDDMFQLEYYTEDCVEKYNLESPDSDKSTPIDLMNVEAKFNLSGATEKGIKLIAIDGQHRLYALKLLSGHPGGVISKLVVPTCILFSTSASIAAQEHRKTGKTSEVPNVPGTFRKVFVDVNSKMEAVGAHTNILLNDTNIGSLIVREFCGLVNREAGSKGLACVEWNIKSVKDSTILTRQYSLTSVGILEKALKECFEKESSLLRRILDIDDADISEKLSQAADDLEQPQIEWESFSIAQRRLLIPCVEHGIVRVLYELFFDLDPYSAAHAHFLETLAKWEKRGSGNWEDSDDHQMALEDVLNFREPKAKTGAVSIIRSMNREQRKWRESNLSPVIGFALFQRAMMLTIRELLVALPQCRIREIGNAAKILFKSALDDSTGLYRPDRIYTIKTIWHESGSIVNREQTRRQLSRLTLALLGGGSTPNKLANEVSADEAERIAIIEKLRELGEERAGDYWQRYVIDRESHFGKTYLANLALDARAVDELREAEKHQKSEREQIKAGELEEDDAKKPFDKAVHKHLVDEFRRAEEEMREVLDFEKHIVSAEFFGRELDDDE